MKIEIIKKNINFGGIVSEINITQDLNNEIINELYWYDKSLASLSFTKERFLRPISILLPLKLNLIIYRRKFSSYIF